MRLPTRASVFALTFVLAACSNNRSSTNGNNNNDLDPFDFDTSDAADVEDDRNWNDQGGPDVGEDPDVLLKPDADVEPDPDAQNQDVAPDADAEPNPDAAPDADAAPDVDVQEPDADVEPDVPPGRTCAILFAEGEGDFFGSAVALNRAGNRLAAGARSNRDGGDGAGHVRVFERAAGEWTQVGSDIDGTEGAGAGHSLDINAEGDRVVVGFPFIGADEGEARVFQFTDGDWAQMGSTFPGLGRGSVVGQSVAMNAIGDRVVIGIRGNSFGAAGLVYEWRGDDWVQIGDELQTADWGGTTGWSISMNAAGDRVAMGATTGAVDVWGRAEVFEWVDDEWASMGGPLESGRAEGDQFGYCTSLNAAGDRLVVGARFDGTAARLAGSLRAYQWAEGAWTQLGDTMLGSREAAQLGQSCGMDDSGDRIVSGEPVRPGLVRAYEWVDGAWEPFGDPISEDDLNGSLGHSAAISGDGTYAVGGAPLTVGPSFVKVCSLP